MALLALILMAATIQPALETVTVRATGDCPSAPAIRDKLATLIGAAAPGRAPDRAEVAVVGSALSISLRHASGEVVGEKRIAASAGCAARAETAAIVLAAWEAQLGDHAAPELVSPLAPPPQTPPSTTGPEAGPAARTPALPSPPPPPRTLAPTVVSAFRGRGAPPPEPRRWTLTPGGSLLASIDDNDTALAATAEAALSRSGSSLALGAAAMFVGSHAVSVSPGIGSWRRFGVAIDGRRRLRWSRVWLEARAGAILTLVAISGSALAENGGGNVLDPGVVGGLRLGLTGGPATPWLELGATVWPRRQTLDVQGGGAADLPLVDVLAGVGFSFQGWR